MATKHDLLQLEERFETKLGAGAPGDGRAVRAELVSQTRTFVFATIASLAFAVARLV